MLRLNSWNKTMKGGFTYFVKGEMYSNTTQQKLSSFGGYLLTPLEIVDGKIRMTFIGKPNNSQLCLKHAKE